MTDKPTTSHNTFAARLQVLTLPGGKYVLIFDQWDGPPIPSATSEFVKRVKEATGAQGVLIFEGTVDIDC